MGRDRMGVVGMIGGVGGRGGAGLGRDLFHGAEAAQHGEHLRRRAAVALQADLPPASAGPREGYSWSENKGRCFSSPRGMVGAHRGREIVREI